jgi:hypothetical protein
MSRLGELPGTIAGWSLTQIAAGWWLSAAGREAPGPVRALSAEPGRPSMVIDASGPDRSTDQLLSELFGMLSSAGLSTVRLVLSDSADRYAAAASRAHDIDVMAAEAAVVITPHGYALVRPAEPVGQGVLPQWRRCLPGGQSSAGGALAPSPAWERGLHADVGGNLGQRITARRVPAGLALQLPGQDVRLARAAQEVWPDPERLSIVIDPAAPRDLLHDSLAQLMARLPLDATDGIRLWWPRAGVGAAAAGLQELASRFDTDLIVPAADISPSGYGGVCHGPAGAAPWLQFGRAGDVSALGSMYPVPAWERALGETDLTALPSGGTFEHVAAGICLFRSESSERGLAATARSIVPDPARATIVVAGDARDGAVRQDVESVLSQLPAAALSSLRLVLTGAGAGAGDSYAQFLAETFGSEIVAPGGRWTATPDGRLRALGTPGAPGGAGGRGSEADGWLVFAPSREPAALESPAMPLAAPAVSPLADVPPAIWSAAVSPGAAGPAVREYVAPDSVVPEPVVPGPVVPGPVVPDPVVPDPLVPDPLVPDPVAPDPVVPEPVFPDPVVPGPIVPDSVVPGSAGSDQVMLLNRQHRSTTKERLAYRESAARYHSYSISVRRMLTQRPGLRSAAAGDAEDAVVTDFAAVLDLLSDDRQAVAVALRTTGTAGNPRVACALSGLRRLPSFTGVVFTSATLLGVAASGYATGRILVEPAFVDASSSRLVAMEGDIDYVLWSETGKRVAAIAAEAGRDEVIFAAGTAYKVLQVGPARPGSSQVRVFLREFGTPQRGTGAGQPSPESQSDDQLDEMDRRVLERLAAAASLRDDAVSDDQVLARRAGGASVPIGLNASGFPFVELTPSP